MKDILSLFKLIADDHDHLNLIINFNLPIFLRTRIQKFSFFFYGRNGLSQVTSVKTMKTI